MSDPANHGPRQPRVLTEGQHEDQRGISFPTIVSGLVSRPSGRLVGWLWLISTGDAAWKAAAPVAVVAVAALAGITWFLSRARAERRWRAALDRYAKQELAKE
jgi:hypothetical protein